MDTLSEEWLNHFSDRIEMVLAAHKIEALVTGAHVSPRWVRFMIQPGLGVKISAIQSLLEELALALDAPTVRVARVSGTLALEIPLINPQPIRLLGLLPDLPVIPAMTAIVGLKIDGEPYTLPLMAPEITHVLVAGMTGCGKTELLRSLLFSLAIFNRQAHVQMALIDPKRRGFGPLSSLPHLIAPIATTPEAALELLTMLIREMERRDQENAPPTPRIIVAVDEVSDLLSTSDKEVEKALVRLAQRGREAGFHLICSTQRPSAEALPGALKANLPTRLIGKVASGQEALTATGIPGSGAELLGGSGDFIGIIGGQITHFQAAYTGILDVREIYDYLAVNADTSVLSDAEREDSSIHEAE
jgi:S-DNA-T family DNA segregation ATPase FtsK/SpoIIIE